MDCVNIGAPGGLSGFQRRIVHQTIRNEFPACRTFGRNDGQFMQVEMLDKDKEERVSGDGRMWMTS
jgi:poly(A)-specific ribonuclease